MIWVASGIALLCLALLLIIWKKGRPFAAGDVFRASRLSNGNRLFPTQVMISPTSVIHYTPEWFGLVEHSMHMAHMASVRIDTNLMFSSLHPNDRRREPIRCHGHRKSDAVRMKQLISSTRRSITADGARPHRRLPHSASAR